MRHGRKNKTEQNTEQLNSFEQLIKKLAAAGGSVASSSELTKLIDNLVITREKMIKKEEEDRCKKEEIEAKRKLEEERAKYDAHIDQVTSMDLPLDWENAFSGDSRTQGVYVDSISDALILSLSNLAKVDIEYISSITGKDCKTVISALKGSIYQNPETWGECFYKGWKTSEEYLSGNLMRKWKAANEANTHYRGYFNDNLKAIEKVLPESVAPKDIYVTLGSPWVPADIIDDFITHILKLKYDPLLSQSRSQTKMSFVSFVPQAVVERIFKSSLNMYSSIWKSHR